MYLFWRPIWRKLVTYRKTLRPTLLLVHIKNVHTDTWVDLCEDAHCGVISGFQELEAIWSSPLGQCVRVMWGAVKYIGV